MCVTVEEHAACAHLLHGNVMRWNPFTGPRLELFLGEKKKIKNQEKTGDEGTSSVLLILFWLM